MCVVGGRVVRGRGWGERSQEIAISRTENFFLSLISLWFCLSPEVPDNRCVCCLTVSSPGLARAARCRTPDD